MEEITSIQVVLPANRRVQMLLGKPRDGEPLEWTSFQIRKETETGLLLYHTMTLELLHIPAALVPGLEQPEGALREFLRSHWFLIPRALDEHQTLRELRQTLGLMDPPASWIKKYTVFTTTACNARCGYCFEKDWTPRSMRPEIADRTAEYMLTHSSGHGFRIDWFGGEPLVNRQAMDRICDRLAAAGASFESAMTTNGYLFSPETLGADVARWHLHACQITLDGREQAYNRIKNYVYPGVNAYRRVIGNIHALAAAGVEVILRLNFDRANFEEICLLARELGSEFAGEPRITAYANILYEFEDGTTPPRSGAEREELERMRLQLLELLGQSGLWEPAPLPRSLPWHMCMADSGDMLTVLPEGQLGLCEQYSRDHFIGHIDRPGLDRAEAAEYRVLRPEIPECADCPIYPGCIRLRRCHNQLCHLQRREGWILHRQRAMEAEWKRFTGRNAREGKG